MSRTPIAFIARDWCRLAAKTRAKQATAHHRAPQPRVGLGRLRRSRASAWPSPITVASAAGSATAYRPGLIQHPRQCLIARSASPMTSSPPYCVPPSPWRSADRGAFLHDVAAALQGQELGDGAVYRTIAQVQRRYYDPPILSAPPRWGP